MKDMLECIFAQRLRAEGFRVSISERKSIGLMCIMPRPRTRWDPDASEMVTYSVDAEDQNFIGPIAQDESTTL
jgi:hypothetical protein